MNAAKRPTAPRTFHILFVVTTIFFHTLPASFTRKGECEAAPPSETLVRKLTDVIREKCPDAQIEVTEKEFIARHGTMQFTMHGRSKTGEVSSATFQQEGPNFKGFLLKVSQQPGPYQGAAVVPQTLQQPYYPVYIDAAATEDGQSHYWVTFAYGSRLDPELKKAIFETIPKSAFPKRQDPQSD